MAVRVCACGCGKPLDGRASRVKYFDHACASRASRRKLTSDLADAGLPTRLNRSLLAGVMDSTANGHGDSGTRARSRSGLQLSFRKAVDVLASYLAATGSPSIVAFSQPTAPKPLIAEAILVEALSERQRQRLRGGTT